MTELRHPIQVTDHIAALDGTGTGADLQRILESLRAGLGLRHVLYHWFNRAGSQIGFGTYPLAWRQRYRARGYQRIDPVVLACGTATTPVDWRTLDWSRRGVRAFRRDALAHGLGSQGLTIPVHGPQGSFAMLSLNHECPDIDWQEVTEPLRLDLILFAQVLHQRATVLFGPAPRRVPHLTQREADVLAQIAGGLSRAEAAARLAISEHTLRDHLESARQKLGAQNTMHTVALALAQGRIVI